MIECPKQRDEKPEAQQRKKQKQSREPMDRYLERRTATALPTV
jgi:hypothetical protein